MVKPDVAVVLSGGGAYAAYEVGVLKAVLGGETDTTGYLPLDPGVYAGSSAGAMNAAALVSLAAAGGILPALDRLEQFWLEDYATNAKRGGNGVFRARLDPGITLSPEEYVSNPLKPLGNLASDTMALAGVFVRRGSDFLLSTGSAESRLVSAFDLADFISSEPLVESLRKLLNPVVIGNSDRRLRVAATNWNTGKVEIFGNEELRTPDVYTIVRASAAIPGIFPPVFLKGVPYVDGGLVMNTPLKPAIDSGATVIHVVYLDPQIENVPPMRLQSTLSIFERSLAINFAGNASQDIAIAAWINEGLRQSGRAPQSASNGKRKDANGDDGTVLSTEGRALFRKSGADNAAHHPLTIHRYHPQRDLSGGFGLLDFSSGAIRKLLDLGYQDGLRHNCRQSGCVIPG